MQRRFRLHRSIDIQRVRRTGKSFASPLVVLIAAPNELQTKRAAFSTSRAVGTAVVRNATRRRMREVMRSVWDRLPDGLDFLMIARARSATVSYQALNRTVMRLLHQAGWIHDLT